MDCVQATEALGIVLWRYIMEDSRGRKSLLYAFSVTGDCREFSFFHSPMFWKSKDYCDS